MLQTPRRLSSVLALLALALIWASPGPAQAQSPGEQAEGEMTAPDEPGDVGETEDEDEKWSVTEPPETWGEWSTVAIDTAEMTWSNVDVSPDGETIVFDMLGDIYTVPLEGGDATALTEGIDWSFQPRYSPDGSQIAFISDRSGGDNLWIMGADGSEPRQVTAEKEHLVHNPNWSPDGRYLVAKKGFTSTRSIPAGEIWMFHAQGNGSGTAPGLQLVERPGGAQAQKNIAEPAFSRDGGSVYFSQDVTSGLVWQYDKDPTGQIFAIQELDLASGEVDLVTGGPGGAIRPTPSPDGETLAFVRRLVGMKSALVLRDLDSGREWTVYEDLERDLQETNGSLGNTTAFAWTPDGSGLVFWAAGKIRHLDLATGEAKVVPVRVRTERRVQRAIRFPVDVAPDRVKVQAFRWLQSSPDGKTAVYQALGRIWLVDLASGERRRLTTQEEHVEAYPSFSADGRSLVYVTWDDEELGALRLAPVGDSPARPGRVISTRPGHYVMPRLSADGSHVAYVEAGGGYLLSPLWGTETGVFVLPVDGDDREPVQVADNGLDPHFGPPSESGADRVYFSRYGEGANLALWSVDTAGHEEREVASGSDVAAYRLSPDGQWLAFVEQWKTYVVPFAETGKALSVGSGTSSIPVRQVSAVAGETMFWTGTGEEGELAIGWSNGANLSVRPLREAFAFLPGAPEELPDPLDEGRDLSFEVPAHQARGTIALVGGRIVTMRDARPANGAAGTEPTREVIEGGTVVVSGDRIVAVGLDGEVDVPSDAQVFDVSGKTVIPGLVDAHWHGSLAEVGLTPQQNWALYSSLAFGVTTVHDPSNDTAEVFSAAELQRTGEIVGPRLFSTGRILYGARATGAFSSIQSSEDALFHVRRLADFGAISVKSYNQPRRDQRQQVLAAAEQEGLMVVPEGGANFQHNMTMVVDGHTGLEHSLPIANVYDDVIQLWSATDVGYTPTFVVAYGGLAGENYWYQHTEVWKNERLLRYVPERVVQPSAVRSIRAAEEDYNHIVVAEAAKALRDAGVSVQIGAHGQREGLGAHWEMWIMEQGGFTAWEAIRGATIDGAWYLGMDGDIGSIEEGKLADLVVIDGNPLEDLRRSEYVTHTMIGGELYEVETMNQVAPRQVERAPFYFERDDADFMPQEARERMEDKKLRYGWSHDH